MSFHWNHRVVEFVDEYGDKWLSIQEVYYDEDSKPTGYCDPYVGSDTLEGLKEAVARFSEALTHPVIKAEDLEVKYGVQPNEEDEQ
jgi:hypothetical protein